LSSRKAVAKASAWRISSSSSSGHSRSSKGVLMGQNQPVTPSTQPLPVDTWRLTPARWSGTPVLTPGRNYCSLL
jgi:hypothetical protein